jgi:hypothetical protein
MFEAKLNQSAWRAYSGQLHQHEEASLDALRESISADEQRSCNIRARMFDIYKDGKNIGSYADVFGG